MNINAIKVAPIIQTEIYDSFDGSFIALKPELDVVPVVSSVSLSLLYSGDIVGYVTVNLVIESLCGMFDGAVVTANDGDSVSSLALDGEADTIPDAPCDAKTEGEIEGCEVGAVDGKFIGEQEGKVEGETDGIDGGVTCE